MLLNYLLNNLFIERLINITEKKICFKKQNFDLSRNSSPFWVFENSQEIATNFYPMPDEFKLHGHPT